MRLAGRVVGAERIERERVAADPVGELPRQGADEVPGEHRPGQVVRSAGGPRRIPGPRAGVRVEGQDVVVQGYRHRRVDRSGDRYAILRNDVLSEPCGRANESLRMTSGMKVGRAARVGR